MLYFYGMSQYSRQDWNKLTSAAKLRCVCSTFSCEPIDVASFLGRREKYVNDIMEGKDGFSTSECSLLFAMVNGHTKYSEETGMLPLRVFDDYIEKLRESTDQSFLDHIQKFVHASKLAWITKRLIVINKNLEHTDIVIAIKTLYGTPGGSTAVIITMPRLPSVTIRAVVGDNLLLQFSESDTDPYAVHDEFDEVTDKTIRAAAASIILTLTRYTKKIKK